VHHALRKNFKYKQDGNSRIAVVADARDAEVKDGCYKEARRFGCAASKAKQSYEVLPGSKQCAYLGVPSKGETISKTYDKLKRYFFGAEFEAGAYITFVHLSLKYGVYFIHRCNSVMPD
jgi:hypothetical protein